MVLRAWSVRTGVAAVAALSLSGVAGAQTRAFEVSYGGWKADSVSMIWSAAYRIPLIGPFDYAVALSHVADRPSATDRTQTGVEFTVGAWRDGSGPYAVAGVGMGMKHYDGNLDASWSVGLGWALPVLPFLSVGLEGRYRVEDQFTRGFWRLDPTDRRGAGLSVHGALLLSALPRRRAAAPPPVFEPSSSGNIERAAREGGASKDAGAVAADVVGTALQVMGTPYRWGGDGANGYDCSGLIQYAYGAHGIILPRVSREQARMGSVVDRQIEALHPGDILGFAVEGASVTHVGLYIGEGQFIHSASSGVKLSSLTAIDPDSMWWKNRWIVTRRILQ